MLIFQQIKIQQKKKVGTHMQSRDIRAPIIVFIYYCYMFADAARSHHNNIMSSSSYYDITRGLSR